MPKKKLVHVVCGLVAGGIEHGIFTLAEGGFYNAFDAHLVELYHGQGPDRDRVVKVLGDDRIISILGDKEKKRIPFEPGLKRLVRQVTRSLELPRLVWGLQGIFAKLEPDTVVLSDYIAQLVGRTAATLFPEIKTVSFEHNTIKNPLPVEIALKLTSFRNDAVVGDSAETVKFHVPGHYGLPQPIDIIPLAMLERGAERALRQPERFQVLSLGRLVPQKNYNELIHAAAQLLKEGHKLDLVIAGEGLQKPMLENIIREHDAADPASGVAKHIKLLGFVAGDEALQKLRDTADIYIQPSLFEGFSIATAEALAAGLPTITTDFAGVRDYGNAKNIVKINGYRRENIADALRHVIVNYKSLAPRLSEAALETARSYFSEGAVRTQWARAVTLLETPRYAPAEPAGLRPSRHNHYTFL